MKNNDFRSSKNEKRWCQSYSWNSRKTEEGFNPPPWFCLPMVRTQSLNSNWRNLSQQSQWKASIHQSERWWVKICSKSINRMFEKQRNNCTFKKITHQALPHTSANFVKRKPLFPSAESVAFPHTKTKPINLSRQVWKDKIVIFVYSNIFSNIIMMQYANFLYLLVLCFYIIQNIYHSFLYQ